MQKEPIGLLFGSTAYYSPQDVDTLIDNLTPEQSFYFLTQAIEFSYKSGIYTLAEAELLSKSLRIFTNKNVVDESSGQTESGIENN